MTNTNATVIGPGVSIKGNLHSRQDVVLHGNVQGDLEIENSRLTVGPSGKARGKTTAREVDIQGSINGNVDSLTRVSVRTGGELIGDIRAAGIVIEEEAIFQGSVIIVRPEPAPVGGEVH